MNKAVVLAEYQGLQVNFTEDGWFNATTAAEWFGKRVDNWMRLQETQEYIAAVMRHSNTSKVRDLIKTKRGNQGGTWLHPRLAIAFARWLSPDFAIWCDLQIDGLIRGDHPHFDWKHLRHEAISSFTVMNDALKLVREEQGKVTDRCHYQNEARRINWVLAGKFKSLERELLPPEDLNLLARLEVKNSVLIGRGVEYAFRKKILEQYALDLRPLDTKRALT